MVLYREFRKLGSSYIEVLYADDLAVFADSLEECIANLKTWKTREKD